MEGMSVMGSTLRVELARSAVNASANLPRDGTAPFAAMHASQMAQLQLQVMQSQGQQDSLAAQVAQMRASAKTFAALPSQPLIANNSQSQKAAALAAAAALSKRLTGISTSYIPPQEKERSRDSREHSKERGRSPGHGSGRRGPKPYSPPRKRPSGRARSASPRSRAVRLQRTDNREREAMRAKEEAARRQRSHSRRRSPSPPPRRRSRSPARRRSRSPIRSARSGRRSPSPMPSRRRPQRRSPSPVRRSRSPSRRHRESSRDHRRSYRDDPNRDRRGSHGNRDRSPIPRTRTPDRRDRRSPTRTSVRQAANDDVHYSKRRRYSPSDSRQDNRHNRQSVEDTAPGEVSPARMASTEANEATDHTAAALEAATAGIDAAAVVSETAVAGGADSPPEAHPAAASAPEAEGDEEVSHVANTAQIVDTADHKRSHRKYRKREGSQSMSPQREEKRSKKKRHHDKADRDSDKKHNKHKQHKRRHERVHGSEEKEVTVANGTNPEAKEAEPDVTDQQEREQLQLRHLALSKIDNQANENGADASVSRARLDSENASGIADEL